MIVNQLSRIESALTTLVLDQPFFAVLALRLDVKETDKVPTFATDGKRLFFNTQFCEKLSDKQILTVLAHEVLHCALGHIWRGTKDNNHMVWNIACDNEVNWQLQECNDKAGYNNSKPFEFPDGVIKENRFQGVCAEEVYNILMKELDENKITIQDMSGQDGEGQGEPQQGQGQGDKPTYTNSCGEMIPCREDKKSETQEEWEQAVIQAHKATTGNQRGYLPSMIEKMIEIATSAKLDWKTLMRDYLQDYAKDDWSFAKSNPRYADGDIFMPTLHSEKVPNLAFAIDTSGSISDELVGEFLAEVQLALDTLNPEYIEIIYCDTEVQKVVRYESGDQIEPKRIGGGGTDFRPVFDYCNKKDDIPRVLVYLTDLYGAFPEDEPEYETIWITKEGESDDKVPFGTIVEV